MWSQDLLPAVKALGLFAFFSCGYWFIFKTVHWRSSLLQALTARVRLWAYLLVPLVPLAWLSRRPPPFLRELSPSLVSTFMVFPYVVGVVFAIGIVEAISAVVFDYLFAVRQRADIP